MPRSTWQCRMPTADWLTKQCERAAEQSVLTCLSFWQNIINNISLTLSLSLTYLSRYQRVSPTWAKVTCSLTHKLVCERALSVGTWQRNRGSLFISPVYKAQRDEISHQSLVSQCPVTWSHSSSLSHTLKHTFTCKQVNSPILLLRRIVVFLRNTDKYSVWSEKVVPWLHFIRSKTVRRHLSHTVFTHQGSIAKIQHCLDNS